MEYLVEEQKLAIKKRILKMLDEIIGLYEQVSDLISNIDYEKSKEIIHADKKIDALEIEINDMVVEYIIANAPIATDLREAVSNLKIVTDLERIADYTKNIAKIIRKGGEFSDYDRKKVLRGLAIFTEFLGELKDLLDSPDISVAFELVEKDDLLDDLYKEYYVGALMSENKYNFESMILTLSTLKYIERAGDHIVNIIEGIIYTQKGRRVAL